MMNGLSFLRVESNLSDSFFTMTVRLYSLYALHKKVDFSDSIPSYYRFGMHKYGISGIYSEESTFDGEREREGEKQIHATM